MQLVLEIGNARDNPAARPAFICPICPLVSVALGTHGSSDPPMDRPDGN
jgi:hypothetical protein